MTDETNELVSVTLSIADWRLLAGAALDAGMAPDGLGCVPDDLDEAIDRLDSELKRHGIKL